MRTTTAALAAAFCVACAPAIAAHHASTAHKPRAAKLSASPGVQAELAARDRQIAALQAAVADLQAKVATLQQTSQAQVEVNAATTHDVQALQASTAQTEKKADHVAALVHDTQVSGRVFMDLSDTSQHANGVPTAASGYGLDVKRGYLTVSHRFDDIWSATLTTDFNYLAATGQTDLFIKNLYLQGKFSDAFVFRVGEIPMAWTPFVEGYYGYRYVENTLTDRSKVANTTDWGLSAGGQLADGKLDYAAAVVNGAGFKNPTRSQRMDFEGRIAFSPVKGMAIAVGGYSGTQGKDTATTDALHTASRGDVMVAWAHGDNRLGAEYFTASNWNNQLNPLRDRASGWSVWGSLGLADAWSVFARYDRVNPSRDLDPSLRDRYFNLGLQWAARKNIKLALVYKDDDRSDALNRLTTQEFGLFGDVAF